LTSGDVPTALAPRTERSLVSGLVEAVLRNRLHRYQLVLGPRRVGKTTVMYQTVRRLLQRGIPPRKLGWLRLDHPYLLPIDLGTLVRVLMRFGQATPEEPSYVFLDELVYADQWDQWLKTFYDDRWPIRLVGTSSATAALAHRRVESGVGRWEEQHLAPYHLADYLELEGEPLHFEADQELEQTVGRLISEPSTVTAAVTGARRRLMLTGGFPELLSSVDKDRDEEEQVSESQRILRSDAIDRAIYKDIPQSFEVQSPLLLERLLCVLAGQMTGVLSPSNITKELNLTQPTFDRYLSYLERAFLVFTLPNYSGSETTVQRRGRKLYFVDGAVRNAALQRGTRFLNDAVETGNLLENLVATHLRALAEQENVRLFHWRSGKYEVDLVYDHPSAPMAIEVATSGRHTRRGLLEFARQHPRFHGHCWLATQSPFGIVPSAGAGGVGTVPVDLLLLAIGAQTTRAMAQRFGPHPQRGTA
jgi:predicted AAA+ superfamily ATPase